MNPALGALLLGATCIALSPIFVRLSETGPTATAFWRVALAVPVLWILYFVKTKGRSAPYSGKWPLLFAAGFAFAGDLGFWHTSIQLTSVANSTLLANLASIFVTLAAWIFLRQKPTGVFLAGLAAALAGVAMLVRTSLGYSPTGIIGDALGVVTAIFYAGYILAVKGLRDRGETTLHLMAVTSTITAILLLPVALATEHGLLPGSLYGWGILLGLALISHAAGQGPHRLRPRPSAGGVLFGRPSASASGGGGLRLDPSLRAARSASDRGRRRGARRHLPRPARFQLVT